MCYMNWRARYTFSSEIDSHRVFQTSRIMLQAKLSLINELRNLKISTSYRIILSELGELTIVSEFDFSWAPHTFGRVLNKATLNK